MAVFVESCFQCNPTTQELKCSGMVSSFSPTSRPEVRPVHAPAPCKGVRCDETRTRGTADEFCDTAIRLNGSDVVFAALRAHAHHVKVQQYGLATLANLARCGTCGLGCRPQGNAALCKLHSATFGTSRQGACVITHNFIPRCAGGNVVLHDSCTGVRSGSAQDPSEDCVGAGGIGHESPSKRRHHSRKCYCHHRQRG